jgi:hypothetical protein
MPGVSDLFISTRIALCFSPLCTVAAGLRAIFKMRTPTKLALIVLAGLAASTPAYAYLDPNSGGLIFQILMPIFALATAAVAFTGRTIARGWTSLYRGLRNRIHRVVGTSGRDVD